MNWADFIVVGENIHCTRIILRSGKLVAVDREGRDGIPFSHRGQARFLPIPPEWERLSPSYAEGKVKHAALAVWQAMQGEGANRQAGCDYLLWLAERQTAAGAKFLDVNVDEYSTDPAVAAAAMAFVIEYLSQSVTVPFCIDSSNPTILRAGLERCRRGGAAPMVNSVSLERESAVELVVEFGAEAIVSAAGRSGLPSDVEERLANLREIVGVLERAGVARPRLHLDPLVLPISTDPMNGAHFLAATRQARREFATAHLTGGLSNVSFGMPNRKLLNTVFTWLAVEAGADGGIIDPLGLDLPSLAHVDVAGESFRLARAVLTGEDPFGVEYITAHREGRLQG